jgi:ubiquinone/menaquinone biosynthesis C-methylase UbiE
MDNHDPLQDGAAATYNAASDAYDAPALSFRDRFSHATVERLNLLPGSRVLDVCCGTGAASVAAAEAVGSGGFVLGVDLAERQLTRARAKAHARGWTHADFRVGNLDDLPVSAGAFDAVLCVYGIFFVREMAGALARLWGSVRPGGVLALTTWAERAFEPGNTAFWNAVRQVRPELVRTFPWHRIDTPARLAALFAAAGVPHVAIEAAQAEQPLDAVEDWWAVVLGSGFRATVEQMSSTERDQVRDLNLAALRVQNARAIEAHTLFATARKSSDIAFAGAKS